MGYSPWGRKDTFQVRCLLMPAHAGPHITVLQISSFGAERLQNTPKVIKLVSNGAGI